MITASRHQQCLVHAALPSWPALKQVQIDWLSAQSRQRPKHLAYKAVPFELQLVKFSAVGLLFKMAHAILISYIVCCAVGLIPSVRLIRRDAKPYRTNEMDGMPRVDRRLEKALAVVFDLAQVALLVNDIVAVSMTITSTSWFNWVNLSITCTLQLIVGTNVRTPIRTRQLANS